MLELPKVDPAISSASIRADAALVRTMLSNKADATKEATLIATSELDAGRFGERQTLE